MKDYGKPGSPVDMVGAISPTTRKSWSGVIMRNKKFYEKYLPQGSKIDFQVGLRAQSSSTACWPEGRSWLRRRHARNRIHQPFRRSRHSHGFRARAGLDQCNAFLVRTDAPQFQSSDEAIAWLNGKTVAVPKGSCTDRFAQAVFKRFKIAPSEYLN